jgi:hypothetical protein
VPHVRTGAAGPAQLAWFHVESMSQLMWLTAWVVLAALLALAVLAILRICSTRRVLARRTGFVVLPTDTFAPTRDAIRGWGQVLAGTRRLVRGRWTRRARAVRIVLGGSPEDSRLVVQLHADPDALRRLQVPWFGEVELRRVEAEPRLVEPLLPDRLEREDLAQATDGQRATPRQPAPRRPRRQRRSGGGR